MLKFLKAVTADHTSPLVTQDGLLVEPHQWKHLSHEDVCVNLLPTAETKDKLLTYESPICMIRFQPASFFKCPHNTCFCLGKVKSANDRSGQAVEISYPRALSQIKYSVTAVLAVEIFLQRTFTVPSLQCFAAV